LHPPADQPPDEIDQIIEGYAESFDQKVWDIELNLSPSSPFRIFQLANTVGDSSEFLGYLIPTACTLASAVADTTTLSVSITTATAPLWSTGVDDWYGDRAFIRVGGEQMLVKGVAGAVNPQTLTVTRGAHGTTAATHVAGTVVEFVTPGVLGL
jgi:hypothetical protein